MPSNLIQHAFRIRSNLFKQGVARWCGGQKSPVRNINAVEWRHFSSAKTNVFSSQPFKNSYGFTLPTARLLHTAPLLKSKDDSSKPPADANKEEKPQSVNILSSMFGAEEGKKSLGGEAKSEEKGQEEPKEETPFERSQRYAKWSLMFALAVGVPVLIFDYGRPMLDEDGDVIQDQYSHELAPVAYVKRTWGELMQVRREFVEPSSRKLLPDPVKEPYYQPPYTLVMELMDVFLHPVYDSVTGWRFKKRPGIDYFFSQVGPPLYEIVIFTKELGMTAFPLIESMDHKGYIMYRLFRDSARYQVGFSKGDIKNGVMPKLDPYYQKDLRYLNRDLSKVIMIDCDKRAFEKNPDNGLCIKPWDGSSQDSTLYDLAALLRTIAANQVSDVREVVSHYNKHDDVLEAFKQNQKKMEEDEEFMKKFQQENPPQLNFLSGKNPLSSWFSNKS